MEANNLIKITDNLEIEKLDIDQEDKIVLRYYYSSQDMLVMQMNISILQLIFGSALLNCMVNGLESSFSFDNVFPIVSMLGHNYLDLFKEEELFSIKELEKKELVVIMYNIKLSAKRENNGARFIRLQLKSKFGFVKNRAERFKSISGKNRDLEIDIPIIKTFELINFAMQK